MAHGFTDNALIRFWSLDAIRLSSTEASNPIIIIGDETPSRIFDSFSELVSSYLTDADLLLSNIQESPDG